MVARLCRSPFGVTENCAAISPFASGGGIESLEEGLAWYVRARLASLFLLPGQGRLRGACNARTAQS